jgi:cyanophycin synthetase
LYREADLPVFENGKIIAQDPDESVVMIAVPTFFSFHGETLKLFYWLIDVFGLAATGCDMHALLAELPAIRKQLSSASPVYGNTPKFLEAAFEAGIPFLAMPGEVYQFGYGSLSRLLESSFTDETPAVGVHFARLKSRASAVLKQAGFPVSEQRRIADIDAAEKAAEELGFPLVVKPEDLDGGVGVAAGLTLMEEVREAFVAARHKSRNILLEKHFEGKDYRLLVFQDELVYAIERIPGGVTGDGKSTVGELVEQVNLDPNRGEGRHALLKRLAIDHEAKSLLGKKGMDISSIPAAGEFVRLRRTANIANGGTPSLVFDRVHPDNALLAVRAARLMRLDLAGIDLLVPDISRSWRETGGVVCEVNAQPGLGGVTSSHLYSLILKGLVKGTGRIPVTVIIGEPPAWKLAGELSSRLGEKGIIAGIAGREGVVVGDAVIHGPDDLYAAGGMLLMERRVGALLFCINDTTLLGTGLPFDRVDLLVVAGSDIGMPTGTTDGEKTLQIETLFEFLVPCCDRFLIVNSEAGPENFGQLLSIPAASKTIVRQHEAVDFIIHAMTDSVVG